MKSARAASLGDGLLDGGGQDTTQGLLDQALGDAGAGQAGLGITAAIHRQLSPGG
jgi:peptidoglycan hydrolase FlgJ